MDEFILKEKHKYWDNKITLEEYIKDTEESGYIDCTDDNDYEFWYILENLKKLNNLQSKIDKAIEYINNNLTISSILDDKKTYCLNDYSFNYEELLDILKENSNEN